MQTKRTLKRASVSVLAAALVWCAGHACSVFAQTAVNPADLNGREFDGVRLPGTVQTTDVAVRAAKAWTWTEGGVPGDFGIGGAAGSTQRLYLQGDVVIEIGQYRFSAANAVVWVQTLGPSAAKAGDPDRRLRQIGIVFDRVSDPGAQAGFSQAADRLLVTAKFDGFVDLKADSLSPGKPVNNSAQTPFLTESETRMQKYLQGLVSPTVVGGLEVRTKLAVPAKQAAIIPGRSQPFEPNAGFAEQPVIEEPPAQEAVEPIFAKSGVVTFAVGTNSPTGATAPRAEEKPGGGQEYVKIIRGQEDNVVLLSGGVALQYTDVRKSHNLQISAERAVVFLAPGPLTQLTQFGADQVRGMYLEGDVVATDGQYTLRGPRVYYDLQANKATMAEAVFTVVDPRLGIPVYVRAKSLKQLSANQFKGEDAKLSTSSFFTPTFSVGVKTVTITQKPTTSTNVTSLPGLPADRETYVESGPLTLRLYDTPLMLLPGYKGQIGEVPLSDIRVENSSSSGSALKTAWNIFSLAKVERPKGVYSDFILDFYFDRGWAVGNKTSWSGDTYAGRLFAYMLPNDDGHDLLSTGQRKEQDQQFRGVLLAENRIDLNEHWTVFTEVSSVSDPSFLDGFFKPLTTEGREVETAGYLRRIDDRSELSLLGKVNLNRYVPNQYLLESQGYTVEKEPELKYARLADDVLKGVSPGLITWNQEYSIARMKLQFNNPPVSEFGFITNQQAQAAFGVNANQSIADRLKAQGLNQNELTRWDTRQELVATIDANPFKIMPFGVFRFTGYDEKFGDINAFAPDAGDNSRTWFAGGLRASTQVVHVDDTMENSFFDLHRIRHIIEPSLTAWTAGATNRQENLPVYDDSVEALNTGSAVRTGVTQTWQTQRGGPGRWQSVDVFKLSTDVTFASEDKNVTSPIGRFFDARPEYAFLGNYFTTDAEWKLSDVVSLVGTDIYDFDTHQQARTTAGGLIQHSPEFSSYAQMRYVKAFEATYVDFGFNYQLTRIYLLTTSFTYDTSLGEIQYSSATLRRRWPEATLGLTVSYNTILRETSVSAVFEPTSNLAQIQAQKIDRLRDVGR